MPGRVTTVCVGAAVAGACRGEGSCCRGKPLRGSLLHRALTGDAALGSAAATFPHGGIVPLVGGPPPGDVAAAMPLLGGFAAAHAASQLPLLKP
jgi:hypothetical protein